MSSLPRLTHWLIASLVVFALAILAQLIAPANLLAVTLFKAHLLSLGGWAGYWLDRGLFPYARPHESMALAEQALKEVPSNALPEHADLELSPMFLQAEQCMLRRAIIVAACLVCVGLGA